MFNYYSFMLDGKERIYYTYVTHSSEEEILEWAERFSFISEEEMARCTDVRELTPEEVEERNDVLYKEWWEVHKNDESLSGKIPPTIGEVQLN